MFQFQDQGVGNESERAISGRSKRPINTLADISTWATVPSSLFPLKRSKQRLFIE